MKAKLKALMLVLAGAALGVAIQPWGQIQPSHAAPATKETAYERVMRTGVLRCGYVVLPPQLNRDPNTGTLSGVAYDMVMQAAARLNLKVEWTEQVTFATMGEGIKAGRYDAFCLTTYRWTPMARVFDFTNPVFHSTVDAYVRVDDARFDRDLQAINNAKISITTIDGEGGEEIRNENFANAKLLTMPQNSEAGQLFEAVASGKADVTFANPLMAMPYMVANPGKLKRVTGHRPIRSYAHALAFGKGETELTGMFDLALEEMRNDGALDQILDKYEQIPGSFVRVKPDWKN